VGLLGTREGGAWCEKMVPAEKGREIAPAIDEHSRKSLLLDGDLKEDRLYRWRISARLLFAFDNNSTLEMALIKIFVHVL
jgi:hypothetical protein